MMRGSLERIIAIRSSPVSTKGAINLFGNDLAKMIEVARHLKLDTGATACEFLKKEGALGIIKYRWVQ